jgi:signal transduction histidine kinase
VVLLLNSEPRRISEQERRLLSVVSRDIASMEERARLLLDLAMRDQELTALHEISRAVGSTLDLDPLMDMIVRTAARVMGVKGAVLRVLDEEASVYRVTSVFGPDIQRHQEFKSGPESDCEVVRTGQAFLIKDTRSGHSLCLDHMRHDINGCLCVPLVEEGNVLGVLSVYDRAAWPPGDERLFEKQDITLLQTLAGFVANAISRAMHHRRIARLAAEKDSMVRELSILYATSAAMMGTVEMDRLLQVILLALTLGDGLGFNRAMLLLVNEAQGVLEGKVGVGPSSGEEAGRVWGQMESRAWTLSQWLEWALEQDRWRDDESLIQRAAREIRVPLTDEGCFLIRALRERKPFCVDPRAEPLVRGLPPSLELAGQLACVPVVARGDALGVILVDNLYSGGSIRAGDLNSLAAFASQAGLAIQNAMFYEGLKKAHKELQSLQQRLIQSEKMAALGEFASTMAHEIRNPLVSIGGYARLLQKRYRNSYSQIIFEEVERLERILNGVLSFSKVSTTERKPEDFNAILDEILRSLRRELDQKRIRVEREWTQGLPLISCDKDQIKQVFLNLIQNAQDAMAGRGVITLRTYLASDEGGLWVVGEVVDSGRGIPTDVLQNIFNPFFTTKAQGTGLGLPITRRMVEAHGGRIEVDNRPGEGTTFRVKLPVPV